ncbi:MAG TPA: TadE/TadG family type IV pilus assembly protein [Bryobacteraceae bacterium]|nr:TadE/TadG family type IV pilus assembly protein [Bryobacteraceae bacterium]
MSTGKFDDSRSRGCRSGTAILEFTFCAPLLISLALGTLQFGYAFFVYGELEQAVRAAGRYASLRSYFSATTTPDSAYLTAVRNVAVYGSPGGAAKPVASGLTTANVNVTVQFVNGVPATVGVAINDYRLPFFIGSVRLTRKPTVQFPYLGIYAPI